MSEETVVEELPKTPRPNPLKEALNRARQQEAERSDVIVDLREAELARLELLQDALSEVFESVPDDNDLLGCALVPSFPPRLWVDVLGHVVMGRDKRTYRFLKDTRYGRQVVLETANLDEMAARITDYVAHRLIERERALESDAEGKTLVSLSPQKLQAGPKPTTQEWRFGWGTMTVAFLLGLLAGVVALFVFGLIITAL
jgi:hypothetical protein